MKNNFGKSPYALLSYPRAGSHYLQNLMLARFGITADRHHWMDKVLNKDRVIIGVVRNPVDSIASGISIVVNSGDVPGSAGSHVSAFIDSMDEILDNAHVIIDFEELISDTDGVAHKLSEALGLRLFDNGHDISVQRESGRSSFLPSAKDVKGYQEAKQSVLDYPKIGDAIDKYNTVLAKCI